MRNTHLLVTLVILFFTVSIASVFGGPYSEPPLIHSGGGVAGAPALAGNNFGGTFTTTYPNGRPVKLFSPTQITLRLCGSICVTVPATITQVKPGTYTYSFVLPTSLVGAVTIFVSAGSLTDEWGQPFPSSDTQIGTYSSPTTTASTPTGQNNATTSTPKLLDPDRIANAAIRPQSSQRLTQQAVEEQEQTKSGWPISQFILALVALMLGACGVLILPVRKA